MKNLRKLTGFSIVLTLFFMVVALFQYEVGEDLSSLPDQFEYYMDDDWVMVSIPLDQNGTHQIAPLVQDALAAGDSQEVRLPYRERDNSREVLVFQNTLVEDLAGMTLSFSTTDAAVSVVLDGETVYQYGIEDNLVKAPSGSKENFVHLPDEFGQGKLWIELISIHPGALAELGRVKIETRDAVVINVIGSNIADLGCCILMLFMAFILFVLALIRWYTHQPSRGEVFMGLSGLAAGLYCFIGTDTLNLFYEIYEAYAVQEYLLLLIPLFLALYFEKNLRMEYPRRFSVLMVCVSAGALSQILLQVLGVCSMEDMIPVSAAAVCVVGVTAVVSLIQFDHMHKRFLTLLSVLSLAVLLFGGVVNMIFAGGSENWYGDKVVQYSMTVFGIMMAVIHVLQLSREYRENAENNALLLEEKVKVAVQQNMQLTMAKKDADAARQEALAANEAKGRFLANMSHEIRTPINAVLGMDEMILRETKEQQTKEYAMDIYTAGQTLLSLINDILDFSKIESGKMEIVPVEYDISSMIHDLANMTLQRAKNKNISFEVEVDSRIPSRLYGDDVRIRQVLANILTNAVKYTHEGTVWLRVRSCKTDETATLMFEVEDTGIGIREEDLPRLSAEFERIEEDRNRNIEGTGLGMSITIQLLALLGSRLQVESIYGEGSKFSFALDQKIVDHTPIGDFVTRVQQIAEQYRYSSKFRAPDAKILVVDDNPVNRRVLRNLLKETLIQVTDAEGGLECLELVQKERYDIIFLDHMMPEMDGVETLHHIRELSEYPCKDTPIVALTANAVSGAREIYLSEGFDDFLSKPVVPDKLENMIQKMLPAELLQESVSEDHETDLRTKEKEDGAENYLEELPQVDGLDWQYAWLHLPDRELLEYTVKAFYAQIDSAADRLEQFYEQITEQGQLEQYRIQVHAMKSLAATVGITPLSGVAKLLEYAARDGNIDVVTAVTPAFLEEWRSYRQKLQGLFGIEAAAGKEITDSSVILALVEMVRLSMQEMDIDQADQLIRQLQTYQYPREIERNIRKLAEAVTSLNQEEADQSAALLIRQLEQGS